MLSSVSKKKAEDVKAEALAKIRHDKELEKTQEAIQLVTLCIESVAFYYVMVHRCLR